MTYKFSNNFKPFKQCWVNFSGYKPFFKHESDNLKAFKGLLFESLFIFGDFIAKPTLLYTILKLFSDIKAFNF